jgi:putative membrane protein
MFFVPHPEPMGPLGLLFAVLGGLAWLAIVAGIVLLIIWAVRALPSSALMRSNAPARVESPLDTLARRFASGEISAEEYERSRDLLRGDASKP